MVVSARINTAAKPASLTRKCIVSLITSSANQLIDVHSGVFTGGGSTPPPPMTGPTKIFSIEFNMVYSVLCVKYAVSLAQ
jgi:hypothetical protein